MRRWIIAGIVGAGIVAPLVVFGLSREPETRAGEDGTFANDCCGTVTLSDGKMLLNGQQAVRYTVARDARGPYIMPSTYVGVVLDEGFDIDGTQSSVKLRLNRLPSPTTIVIFEGRRPYIFARQVPAATQPRTK